MQSSPVDAYGKIDVSCGNRRLIDIYFAPTHRHRDLGGGDGYMVDIATPSRLSELSEEGRRQR